MELRKMGQEETNSFFHPDRQNNGGGYSQPRYEFSILDGKTELEGVVHDRSCGDFGTRVYAEVDGIQALFGSMVKGSLYSDFPRDISQYSEKHEKKRRDGVS